MTTLTRDEEAKYAYLQKEGYSDLADSVRSSWIRAHDTFEKLKKADVDSLYGPAVTEEMRSVMKKEIANGNHDVVHALHSLLLTIDGRSEPVVTPRKRSVPVGLTTFGILLAMLSTVAFAVAILFVT